MATVGELVVGIGLIATATATAFPQLQVRLDDERVAGAARYLSSRLAETRMDAIQRSRQVALRFGSAESQYPFTTYEDGNGNGVLTADIQRGVDRAIRGPELLSDQFRSVQFGIRAGLPPIDPGEPPPGLDPLKIGSGNSVSFSPIGFATSGTLYLTGRGRTQYAVRIVGATGKVRVYRYDWPAAKWMPL